MVVVKRLGQLGFPEMLRQELVGQELAMSILITVDCRPKGREFTTHTSKMVTGSGKNERHLALRSQRIGSIKKAVADACSQCYAAADPHDIASKHLGGIISQRKHGMLELIEQFRTTRRHHGQTELVVLVKCYFPIPLQRQLVNPAVRSHGNKILKLSDLCEQAIDIVCFESENALIKWSKGTFTKG